MHFCCKLQIFFLCISWPSMRSKAAASGLTLQESSSLSAWQRAATGAGSHISIPKTSQANKHALLTGSPPVPIWKQLTFTGAGAACLVARFRWLTLCFSLFQTNEWVSCAIAMAWSYFRSSLGPTKVGTIDKRLRLVPKFWRKVCWCNNKSMIFRSNLVFY